MTATATATATAAPKKETSAKRAEANRKNAQKSTGPTSAAGKQKVRRNALTHGLTAKTLVLPGEDADALQARILGWMNGVQPQSDMEEYLVECAANVSWQLDRANRTIAARLTDQMRFAAADQSLAETDEVADLGRRLFWDCRGPLPLYPHSRGLQPTPRISWPGSADDPLNPARIVNQLEGTVTGCQWLVDRWRELEKVLDRGLNWQAPDRLKAIRMLGAQPMDAMEDDRVLAIYLACDVMDPSSVSALRDIRSETNDFEENLLQKRMEGRNADELKPADAASARVALQALVLHTVTRLEVVLGVNRERQALGRERLDALAFDDSPEGERLRRYQMASYRALLRTIATIYKVRKEAEKAAAGESGTDDVVDPTAWADAMPEEFANAAGMDSNGDSMYVGDPVLGEPPTAGTDGDGLADLLAAGGFPLAPAGSSFDAADKTKPTPVDLSDRGLEEFLASTEALLDEAEARLDETEHLFQPTELAVAGWVQPTDVTPGHPVGGTHPADAVAEASGTDALLVGWVQPTDVTPGHPVGGTHPADAVAEASPIAPDKTKPTGLESSFGAPDETKPTGFEAPSVRFERRSEAPRASARGDVVSGSGPRRTVPSGGSASQQTPSEDMPAMFLRVLRSLKAEHAEIGRTVPPDTGGPSDPRRSDFPV